MTNLFVDNKILETRLLTKDSVVSAPSLTRAANKLLNFQEKKDKSSRDGFLREILLLKLELKKTISQFQIFDQQNEEYDKLGQTIEKDISNTMENISSLQGKLYEEKELRKHRIQCEYFAKVVNQYPSRDILKRKLSTLNEQLSSNHQLLETVESEISHKKTQFEQLFQALKDLQKVSVVEELQISTNESSLEVSMNEIDNEQHERRSNRNLEFQDVSMIENSSNMIDDEDEMIVNSEYEDKYEDEVIENKTEEIE